jgi:hypothetical protein
VLGDVGQAFPLADIRWFGRQECLPYR